MQNFKPLASLWAEQAGLSLTWSETPKTGFLVTRTILAWKYSREEGAGRCAGRLLALWFHVSLFSWCHDNWAAPSEFGTYRLCEQRRFRRACASAQSRQNLRCSLIQAVSQEEPSNGKPDPWPLWMAGHRQLKCVMTECSKTQIRLTGLNWLRHCVFF